MYEVAGAIWSPVVFLRVSKHPNTERIQGRREGWIKTGRELVPPGPWMEQS